MNFHHPHTHRLSTRPIMKHLYSGTSSFCSSSSSISGSTFSKGQLRGNSAAENVINRLFSSILADNCLDSSNVSDQKTIKRFNSLMESGRLNEDELEKKEVIEALKKKVEKEVEKTLSSKKLSKGISRFSNKSIENEQRIAQQAANRVLNRLLTRLENSESSTFERAKSSNLSSTFASKSADVEQAKSTLPSPSPSLSSNSNPSNFSSLRSQRAPTTPPTSSSPLLTTSSCNSSSSRDELTDDSDEFDSGALMAKKKQRRQHRKKAKNVISKKKVAEVVEKATEPPVDDPGDEFISWVDACCSPEPEEAEGVKEDETPSKGKELKAEDLLEMIEKWHMTEEEDEDGIEEKEAEVEEDDVEDEEVEEEDDETETENGEKDSEVEDDDEDDDNGYRRRTGGRFQISYYRPPPLHFSNRFQELSSRGRGRGRSNFNFNHQNASSPQPRRAAINNASEYYYQSASNVPQGSIGSSNTGSSKARLQPRRIMNFMSTGAMPHFPGVNDERMNEILDRTGYFLELSNGQRKYGPSPSHPSYRLEGPPAPACEIFVGRVPREIFEDELIPLFEQVGAIYDLRLMIDPASGCSRGYCFITFFKAEHAATAVEIMNDYEIRPGKTLKVKISIPNVRLFIGNIPKHVDKAEILEEFNKIVVGLTDAIVYSDPLDRSRNRGFCFLEFESHKLASQAKRKLLGTRIKMWNAEILVDWAEPLEEPDEATMSRVRVLYVRNLALATLESTVAGVFGRFGTVERVKKIKDYAFVHFASREAALAAMKAMQGRELLPMGEKDSGEGGKGSGRLLEISLAKPPSDRKRKEEILRNRERRLSSMMSFQGGRSMNASSSLAFNERNYPPMPRSSISGDSVGGDGGEVVGSPSQGNHLSLEVAVEEGGTSSNLVPDSTLGEGHVSCERPATAETPAIVTPPVQLVPPATTVPVIVAPSLPLPYPQQIQPPPINLGLLPLHPSQILPPGHQGPSPAAHHPQLPSASPYQQIAAAAAAAAAIFGVGFGGGPPGSGGHGHGPPPHHSSHVQEGCNHGHHHYHPHHPQGMMMHHYHPPGQHHQYHQYHQEQISSNGGLHHHHYATVGGSGPSPSAVARVTLGSGPQPSPPPPPPSNYLMNSTSCGGSNENGCSGCSNNSSCSSCPCGSYGMISKSHCGPPASLLPSPLPNHWNHSNNSNTSSSNHWYNWYEPNWWYAASCAASVAASASGPAPLPVSAPLLPGAAPLSNSQQYPATADPAPPTISITESSSLTTKPEVAQPTISNSVTATPSVATTSTETATCTEDQNKQTKTTTTTCPSTTSKVENVVGSKVDVKTEKEVKKTAEKEVKETKTKTTSESSSSSCDNSVSSEKSGPEKTLAARTMAQVAAAGAAKAAAALAAQQEQTDQQSLADTCDPSELGTEFPLLSSTTANNSSTSGLKKIGTVPGKRFTGGGGPPPAGLRS